MKMNHPKDENLSFIVAAHLTGPEYKVTFAEEMTDHEGNPLELLEYNEVCIIGPPSPDGLSPYWRVWDALYRPEQPKWCNKKFGFLLAHPWQDYFKRALAKEDL